MIFFHQYDNLYAFAFHFSQTFSLVLKDLPISFCMEESPPDIVDSSRAQLVHLTDF